MRSFILWLLVSLVAASPARAQSYLEKKDTDAISAIERSLAKIDKIPALFDGSQIPTSADLSSVQGLYDQLSLHLRAAAGSFNELSAKGAARTDAQRLRARFDDLERYRAALGPVLSRAQAAADTAARKKRDDDRRAVEVATKVCQEFRDALHQNNEDDNAMGVLTNMVDGRSVFWQTVDEGAKYKGALERTAALCKRMPTAAASCALASNVVPLDARYCDTATKAAELLKRGVANLIAHQAKTTGPARLTASFDKDLGYLDIDGTTTWAAYFSGAKLKDLLAKQIAPLLVQANMSPSDADALFAGLAKEYAELEAKARETAPAWDLPGAPCTGAGCAQAKKFLQQWYRGATIKRFHHTQPGWKILTNEFGIPTYRERYGYALVQVKGDPFCQLRLWTYSEPYAGGGRYTPGRDVALHSVRWQTCK